MAAPWEHLVRVVAHAFFGNRDDPSAGFYAHHANNAKAHAPGGAAASRGLTAVLLAALATRGWVREDQLAKELGLGDKQTRKALVMLEQEQCVLRESSVETVALPPTEGADPDEPPVKVKRTFTYVRVDHAHFADVVTFRMLEAKAAAAGQDKASAAAAAAAAARNADAALCFSCPGCGARYEGFEAVALFTDAADESPTCPRCGAEVEEVAAAVSAAGAAGPSVDAEPGTADAVGLAVWNAVGRCLERCRLHGVPPPLESLNMYMKRTAAEQRRKAERERAEGTGDPDAGGGDLWRAAAQAAGLKADDAEVKVELQTAAGGEAATAIADDVGAGDEWEADAPMADDDDQWE